VVIKIHFCERLLESFQKRALNIGIKCRPQYTHSDVCRSWERGQANCHLPLCLAWTVW